MFKFVVHEFVTNLLKFIFSSVIDSMVTAACSRWAVVNLLQLQKLFDQLCRGERTARPA